MRLTASQRDELIAHAQAEAPNECCGWMRLSGGDVAEVARGVNDRASPYGYSLDPRSLLAAFNAQEAGDMVAIYHSHPRSAAVPSQTDINLAEYPDYVYVILSLLEGEEPLRAWRIADGRVEEETVTVQ